jgi:hypothetical protein
MQGDEAMFKLIVTLWPLWLLLIALEVMHIFRSRITGFFGESAVKRILSRLPKDEYEILNDILIANGDNTSQIDHIVVSLYGIFIIETKNYSGWILGDERAKKWTQVLYKHKFSFVNPIRQNYGHIIAIKSLLLERGVISLPLPNDLFLSLVAFAPKCELKVRLEKTPVIKYNELIPIIRERTFKIMNQAQMASIIEQINNENIIDARLRRQHIRFAKSRSLSEQKK